MKQEGQFKHFEFTAPFARLLTFLKNRFYFLFYVIYFINLIM